MILLGREIVCPQESDLAEVARQFSKILKVGDVCLLYGEVGAGKTFFTTHVYAGMGGRPEITGSPSFSLVHEYPLIDPHQYMYHIDLYRLNGLLAEDDVSQDEWMEPEQGMSFIEWAERLGDWMPERGYLLHFKHLAEGRSIKIEPI